jgi:hypothetical protein
MIFYHYTTLHGATYIALSGKIFKGRGTLANGSKIEPKLGVNLTTSPSCIGHGLPMGQKLSPDLFNKVPLTAGILQNPDDPTDMKLLDHSEFRLEVELDIQDSKLQSAKSYYANNLKLLQNLALTGHDPLLDCRPELEQVMCRAAFFRGDLEDMSRNWYYYFDEIPTSNIKSVSLATAFNVYGLTRPFSVWLAACNKEMGI